MNSLPQITLYAPTSTEIAKVVASAARRHPQLASRLSKAQDILSGGLQLEPTAWQLRNVARFRIASQSNRGAYNVTTSGCGCQDKRVQYCKHAAAVNLYMKILANRLNADIRNREIDLGVLPDGTLNCYAPRMGHVHVRKVAGAYVFCDAASAIRYSLHLAARQPISVEWPVAIEVAA